MTPGRHGLSPWVRTPRLVESLPTPLEAHNLTRPHEGREKYTNQAPRRALPALGHALPAAWIEVLDVFASLTRFTDDPVSVFLDDQILDFRRVMQR
jgi:hypothetical protein